MLPLKSLLCVGEEGLLTLGIVKIDCLYIQAMSFLEPSPGEGRAVSEVQALRSGELSAFLYLVLAGGDGACSSSYRELWASGGMSRGDNSCRPGFIFCTYSSLPPG